MVKICLKNSLKSSKNENVKKQLKMPKNRKHAKTFGKQQKMFKNSEKNVKSSLEMTKIRRKMSHIRFKCQKIRLKKSKNSENGKKMFEKFA